MMRGSFITRLMLIFSLSWLCRLPAQAFAQTAPPADWNVKKSEAGDEYYSPSGKDMVIVSRFGDNATIDSEKFARLMIEKFAEYGCPPVGSVAPQRPYGDRAVLIKTTSATHRCGVLAGRNGNTFYLIMSLTGSGSGADISGNLREGLTRDIFGAPVASGASGPSSSTVSSKAGPPSIQKTVARPTPPVGSAGIGKTVPSSGTSGIWIGMGTRSVYDPVTAIRLEWGLYYLILTPGGYFMTDYPSMAPFSDAAAIAHGREYPEEAGTFKVQGNNLILSFASGKTETVVGKGAGTSRNYVYDDIDYAPKLTFANGTMLNGIYSNTRITRTGVDSFVVGDSDLTFTREGRFARGGNVSISGGWYSILGGEKSETGTYFVRDSAVHLQYDSGKSEIMSIWAEKPNDVIWFDGDMYKLPGG